MSKIVRKEAEHAAGGQAGRRNGLRLVVTNGAGERVTVPLDARQALGVLLAGYGDSDKR